MSERKNEMSAFYPETCEVLSVNSLANAICPANVCRNARLLDDATLVFEVFDGHEWNEVRKSKHEYQKKLSMSLVIAFSTGHTQMCVMSKA